MRGRLIVDDPETIIPASNGFCPARNTRSSRTLLRLSPHEVNASSLIAVLMRRKHPQPLGVPQHIAQRRLHSRHEPIDNRRRQAHPHATLPQSAASIQRPRAATNQRQSHSRAASSASPQTHAPHCQKPAPQTILRAVQNVPVQSQRLHTEVCAPPQTAARTRNSTAAVATSQAVSVPPQPPPARQRTHPLQLVEPPTSPTSSPRSSAPSQTPRSDSSPQATLHPADFRISG